LYEAALYEREYERGGKGAAKTINKRRRKQNERRRPRQNKEAEGKGQKETGEREREREREREGGDTGASRPVNAEDPSRH